MQQTIVHKDRELKDVYKREEKNIKTIQKLKHQLDTVLKEQQRVLSQTKTLVNENQRLAHEKED